MTTLLGLLSICHISFKSFVTLLKLHGCCHARASNSHIQRRNDLSKLEAHKHCGPELVPFLETIE